MTTTTGEAKSRARAAVSPRLRALVAEASGTFILVFAVLAAALFGASFGQGKGGLNLGFLGVAMALGVSVFAGAAAFGRISGAHFNPAVTIGLAVGGRFPWHSVGEYVVAQILGGVFASSAVAVIAAGGGNGFLSSAVASGFASTGWGPLSPGHFSILSAFLVEVVTTGIFVTVILHVTSGAAPSALAPLAIGLTLMVVALIAIPVSNGSFNPARSVASAVWGGPLALSQLWLSLAAPTVGAVLAGMLFRWRGAREEA
jgi:aquaporin Z